MHVQHAWHLSHRQRGVERAMTRDTLDVDVLIVGGGPAGMSAALRLAQLQKEQSRGAPLAIAVLEKARDVGGHMLSGAVLDPSTLRDLIPDFATTGAPLGAPVARDDIYFLTRTSQIRLPITPPFFRNHGNYIISLNRLVKWLGGLVEAEGIDIFTGFAATGILFDGSAVTGVRTGDRGVDRHGQRKSTFEPGVDIRAKVTIFADGVRGNATKSLVRQLGLDEGREPQVYAIGIKELWEVPAGRVEPGRVVHTMGYPLKMEEFGGAFIYSLPDNIVSLGLVSGLDYRDPMFDPHIAFQHLKRHPLVASMLQGGQLVRYGAKALPEGGWHTIPQLYTAGALIAGDAGGFMNSLRLKGIHLAMRTGMLAAETAFDAVRRGDVSEASLKMYDDRVQASAVKRELYPVRNVHQAFSYGALAGAAFAGLSLVTRGWWFKDPLPAHGGWTRIETLAEYYKDARPDPDTPTNPVKIDRQLTFDRLTNVHYSGTRHAEDQPAHLIVHDADICRTRCREEYGNPCTRFCPANVYEMVDAGDGTKKLQINASNCVHCKTCDIMDPYQIIDWVPPEGGGGPQYEGM
ncbi:MAG TPA: electron transfer flavoprotein-ubiquinone oxidoreductase [Vicinamibacterales bacterium]